jgi:hypothetical protein
MGFSEKPALIKIDGHNTKLGAHTKTIDRLAAANVSSPAEFRLSVMEIYRHVQREEGYSGSYGAIKDYITKKDYNEKVWPVS